ncbi:MAG: carboxymuconolactone decarboxylase family protein [Rhodospirillales bacterium]|jgi:uncharacterized peroxidase-related enzyme|nr:carboxymuconolactone decarboxylase family protein [Rhodospirillales bacterium]MDP7241691.1 carboxymuconolactone decarboxylase family protein [Rhodospirillales bacterium]HJO72774.1 carboxymuconolactone decarboxylase family protein [Rhodospirillales bacterium]
MARVRDVEVDEVPEKVRPIYARFTKEYGPFLNQARVFAHRPVALEHLMGMLLDFADEALLSKRYLEIALVVVSKLNECEYCVAHHNPRLVRLGLAPETVAGILEPDCPGLDEVERLVRDYAMQVTNRPQAIDEALFAELKKHFNEAEIVELTLRTTLCGFFNAFNDALEIEMEEGVLEDLLASGSVPGELAEAGPPPAAAE